MFLRKLGLACLLPVVYLSAAARCPGDSFTGTLDFTTRVLGAKSNKAVGVTGYYRMRVTFDAGCNATAEIVKLGFNKVMFAREKLQVGRFKATTYVIADPEGGAVDVLFVDASLASAKGTTLDIGVTLLSGVSRYATGAGFWRHLGKSWEEAGMWGALSWQSASESGSYVADTKPNFKTKFTHGSLGDLMAFVGDGFFVATPDLSRAVTALQVEGTSMYSQIAGAGYSPNDGFWWDVCFEEARESPGPRDHYPVRVTMAWPLRAHMGVPARSAYKTCGGAPPRPAAPAPPRWNGAVR